MSHLSSLQDEVFLQPSLSSTNTPRSPLLIYFIPGNPGLVEYYRSFLQHIQAALSPFNQATTTIYGSSHDGFEVNPVSQTTTSHGHGPPFSLEEVVQGTKRKILAAATSLRSTSGSSSPVRIVLIGHSVGAYIVLEVLAWYYSQRNNDDKSTPFEIVAGIGLFPTIVHIAKSDKGRLMSKVLRLPFVPSLVQALARLLSCVPLWLWNWPRTLTPGEKRPEHSAVTEAIIRKHGGAKQVVFMAADEMTSIKEDKWHPERLWGILPHQSVVGGDGDDDDHTAPLIDVSEAEIRTNEQTPRVKLFFYWGENDYWVDNKIRDKFVAQRARRDDDEETQHWPEMVLDRHSMDHCFSLNEEHSKLVGKQVASWIDTLQESA